MEVQKDILLQLHAPAAETLWEGVERPGLHLAGLECEGFEEKVEALREWLSEVNGPRIVYFTLISTLQKVSAALGKTAHECYHGDLEDRARVVVKTANEAR